MRSLKRKSREPDSKENEGMWTRKSRRLMANLSHEGYSSKSGTGGGSSAKTRTRTRGNSPNHWTANDHHYPPDEDYRFFLDGLGLGLPSAADSADPVGANRACDGEATTHGVFSGLKEDWSDMDIDLFKFLAEKGVGSSIRAEDNDVGNNGDPGANSGCGASMDGGNEAARYMDDDSFLRETCSSDKNGLSCKDDHDTGAETTDDGYDDKSVDSFHVDSEFVEEAGEIKSSADDDNVVDMSFDKAAAAEEVADHCNKLHFNLSDRDQTAYDVIVEAPDPAYLKFLENLREDGNTYNVELPVSGGESLFFAYEKQYVSRGQCNAGETRQTSLERKNGEAEICLGQGCNATRGKCDAGEARQTSSQRKNGKPEIRLGQGYNETRGQCDAGEARQTSSQRKNGEPEISLGHGYNKTQGHCQIRDERGAGCDLKVANESNKSSLTGKKFSYKTENGVRSGFRREEKSQMENLLEKQSKKKGEERQDPKVASGRERRSCSPMKPRIKDEMGEAPENACRTEAPTSARVQAKTGDTRAKKVPPPSLVRDRTTETMPCPRELEMKAQKDASDMQDMKGRRLIPDKTQRKESLNPVPCEEPAKTKAASNKDQQCRPEVERDDMQDTKRRRLISQETRRKESLNPVPRKEPHATTKTPSNRNQQCRPKIVGDQNDECYETFLRSLKKKPMHVEFVPSVGEKVVYDDYPTSSPTSPSESDLVEIDAATFANDVNTPFVPAKDHEVIDLDLEPEESHGRNHYNSVFRVKLLENLRKPYEQREYEELLKEVSCRKQMVKDKELRHGRTVEIKLKAVGQSYLDKYTDFAKKLKESKTDSECHRPVRLNLLRGFVYWLENLPLHGSFKPWLDESCLKVLPSCKLVPWN